MKYQTGQSMVEFVIALSVITVLIAYAIGELNERLVTQHEHLDSLRAELFQPLPQERWVAHPNDHFSRQLHSVVGVLDSVSALEFPIHDRYAMSIEGSPYVLARLTDAWQIASPVALTERPARLSAGYHLKQNGLATVFDLLSYVPMAEELDNNSLQLGKVDADVTPYEMRCAEPSCR